jgi:cytidyltransferase-like protein
MYDTAILIGRFQPLHNGHLALLLDALSAARQVIVVLGSAHAARSPRNPFTWQERAALLHDALPEADRKPGGRAQCNQPCTACWPRRERRRLNRPASA